MSIDVMKLVWDKSKHKETNLIAMLALADMANTDGHCWPSHDTLADRCRCNRRNMVYIIEKLEASGELYVEHNRGRNKSNHYIITIDQGIDTLAGNLIKYFDYPATEAIEKSKKHIEKRNNVQPAAPFNNVQSESKMCNQLHVLSSENVQPGVNNVQPGALKCAAGCTRSVIDPKIDQKPSATRPAPTATGSELATPPATASTTKPADESKQLVTAVMAAYIDLRGKNGVNYAKEGAWAKRIVKEGATVEMVRGCYQWLKQDKFWEFKPLPLAKIYESMEDFRRYCDKKGTSPNGGEKARQRKTITIFNQYTEQYEERVIQ